MSLLPSEIHSSWNNFLRKPEIQKELSTIENKIGENFFPEKENILKFLSLDLNAIKYIIVGMEPYPSSFNKDGKICPQATGRSFEVRELREKSWNDKFKQSSLRNILKAIIYNKTGKIYSMEEIRKGLNIGKLNMLSPGEWFDNMEAQGVLFLNASLTVAPYTVGSHTAVWDCFMDLLLNYINEHNNAVKWLLWGQNAQERVLKVLNSRERTICVCHPRLARFVSENPFNGLDDIEWTGIR